MIILYYGYYKFCCYDPGQFCFLNSSLLFQSIRKTDRCPRWAVTCPSRIWIRNKYVQFLRLVFHITHSLTSLKWLYSLFKRRSSNSALLRLLYFFFGSGIEVLRAIVCKFRFSLTLTDVVEALVVREIMVYCQIRYKRRKWGGFYIFFAVWEII